MRNSLLEAHKTMCISNINEHFDALLLLDVKDIPANLIYIYIYIFKSMHVGDLKFNDTLLFGHSSIGMFGIKSWYQLFLINFFLIKA